MIAKALDENGIKYRHITGSRHFQVSLVKPVAIVYYITCCILRAFLLVLSFDLLEDRRADDVIVGNFFLFII